MCSCGSLLLCTSTAVFPRPVLQCIPRSRDPAALSSSLEALLQTVQGNMDGTVVSPVHRLVVCQPKRPGHHKHSMGDCGQFRRRQLAVLLILKELVQKKATLGETSSRHQHSRRPKERQTPAQADTRGYLCCPRAIRTSIYFAPLE